MSSQTGQQVKKKKRKPKRYDPNIPPRPQYADSRQDLHKNKVIDIDYQKLERYMWTKPTLELTALFFGVSKETIERAIKERYALTFDEFRERNLCVTRHALVQKAIQRAMEHDSDKMLTLALANLAGWSNSVDVQIQPRQTVELRYSLDKAPEYPDVIDVKPEAAGE